MSFKFRLSGDWRKQRAKCLIESAPADWVFSIAPMTRTDEQNRKLWPMIEDLRQQVPGMGEYSKEDVKLRLLNALGVEMRFLPALEGQGLFPVGQRSSLLTKDQFSALIELIYEYGARNGVVWSDPEAEQAA